MRTNHAFWQMETPDHAAPPRDLTRVMWQRKWLLLLFVAAGLGLGYAYDRYAAPVFAGSAQLLLQQVQVGGGPQRQVPHGIEFVDTQAQVIGSPVVVRDAVAALENPLLDATNVENLLVIMDSLKVARVPQTDVVSIAFRNEDPLAAVGLVGQLIEQYQNYLIRQQALDEQTAVIRADVLTIQEELWKAQADERSVAVRYGQNHPEFRVAQEKVAVWEGLLQQQLQTAELAGAAATPADKLLTKTGGVKIAVLDGPALSDGPVWPNPLIVLPLGAAIGLLLGTGLIILFDRGDDSMRQSTDVEAALEMRACGEIPSCAGSDAHNIHRYALQAPDSALARAAYDLGNQLCGANDSEQGVVVQITSPMEQSGKTAVVANLAFSMAQHGKKVCVIDADLRHGILHRVFDVSPSKGISTLSREGTDLEELLQPSPLAPISVLAKGPAIRNPLHLLAQPAIEKLLDSLRWQYDIVLIDTPPLLKVSDASLLAPLADSLLLVLQARVSSAAGARRAIDMLKSVGTRSVGLVLNGSAVAPWMVNGEVHNGDRRLESRRANSHSAKSISVN